MLAGGDIASCQSTWDDKTALLLDEVPDSASPHGVVIAALGDQAYANGREHEYADCYDPTWGRHKYRTRPAPGNHDYQTLNATGYFAYFGSAAGDPSRGYYSYRYGSWHVIVLNSNYDYGIESHATSAQMAWLRAELAATTTVCQLAYWHHPRFSSGLRESANGMDVAWRVLYQAGVDVVLVGHDHFYERLAGTDADGRGDPVYGIRQFTSGMAGSGPSSSYRFRDPPFLTSEVRQNHATGILRLDLDSAGYRWQFLAIPGHSFTDSGSASCHGAPPPPGSPPNARSAMAILDPARYEPRPVHPAMDWLGAVALQRADRASAPEMPSR